MALDKPTLASSLATAMGKGSVTGGTAPEITAAEAGIQAVADAMATAIDTFVKSGTVNTTVSAVTPGVGVASGTGSVT